MPYKPAHPKHILHQQYYLNLLEASGKAEPK